MEADLRKVNDERRRLRRASRTADAIGTMLTGFQRRNSLENKSPIVHPEDMIEESML